MEMRVPPPKLKNPALSRQAPPPKPPEYDAGADLSDTLIPLQCLFEEHEFSWQHPRVVAFLDYCGVKSWRSLNPLQIKTLVEKVKKLDEAYGKVRRLLKKHGFSWEHPRVTAYLERCKVATRQDLTIKQLENLIEKLEQL
jgi:virulence-associated protein VapD